MLLINEADVTVSHLSFKLIVGIKINSKCTFTNVHQYDRRNTCHIELQHIKHEYYRIEKTCYQCGYGEV